MSKNISSNTLGVAVLVYNIQQRACVRLMKVSKPSLLNKP